MATATNLSGEALTQIMTWLSPSFPVGAYSYSHGLENAVDQGKVKCRETAREWIGFLLSDGAGRSDAILFHEAYAAVSSADPKRLMECLEWAQSLRGTSELALESRAQGGAFIRALCAAWPFASRREWLDRLGPSPAYCVAVAAAMAFAGVGEHAALTAYLHATAANLVSAAVRLTPLGQSDGLRILANLAETIPDLAKDAISRSLDDVGSSAVMADLCSMKHETQYTRLFRS